MLAEKGLVMVGEELRLGRAALVHEPVVVTNAGRRSWCRWGQDDVAGGSYP